jgi:hypothetical protein
MGTNRSGSRQFKEALRGEVALCLLRLIHVEEESPADPIEFEHRFRWTGRTVRVHPQWDEARRNLIRTHRRRGEHAQVLEVSSGLTQVTPEDHRIRGEANWALERFEAAAVEFDAGQRTMQEQQQAVVDALEDLQPCTGM